MGDFNPGLEDLSIKNFWNSFDLKNKILSKAIMLRRKIEKYFSWKMGVENMLNYSIVDNNISAKNLQERESKKD